MDFIDYKNYRTALRVTNEPLVSYTDKDNKFTEIFDRTNIRYTRGNIVTGIQFGEPTFGFPARRRNFPACVFIDDTVDNANFYIKECKDKSFIFTLETGILTFDELPELLKNCYDNRIVPNIITDIRLFDPLECLIIKEFCGYIAIKINDFDKETIKSVTRELKQLLDYECTIVLIFNVKKDMIDELYNLLKVNMFGLTIKYILIRFDKEVVTTNRLLPIIGCINNNPKVLIEYSDDIDEKIYRLTYPERILNLERNTFTAHIKNRLMDGSDIPITTIEESWKLVVRKDGGRGVRIKQRR